MSHHVHALADLRELYAEAVATPEFQAAFGDPLAVSIIEPGEAPAEHDMPEPLAAQADCAGIVATLFDLFADTRLEPLAAEIAWGFVNSFHFVAGKIGRREDALADEIGEMARIADPGEVFMTRLEDMQLSCRSLAEQREAIECMRDHAAEMYRALSGWPWSPARGTRASSASAASQIAAQDFLRERALAARERHCPQGPIVVFSGPAIWHDWAPIWERLDQIRARLPHMTLVTTGQRTGADAIAAAWAARPQSAVPVVAYRLFGSGRRVAFTRNRKLADLKPAEAVLCEGSGLQANLYQLLREAGTPIHAFARSAQSPDRIPLRRRSHGIVARSFAGGSDEHSRRL